MKKIITTLIFAGLIVSCNDGAGSSVATVSNLENDDQKAGYAYGMNIGDQVIKMNEAMVEQNEDAMSFEQIEKGLNDYLKLDEDVRESYATGQNIGMSIQNFIKQNKLEGKMEPQFIVQGLLDVMNKKETLVDMDSVHDIVNNYLMGKMEEVQGENTKVGQAFLDEQATKEGVQKTESGLLYEVIEEGSGRKPSLESTVEVNYIGKTIDGNVFDQTKGEPIKFPLNGVISGWQEGLQLMNEGAKYKLYIPSELAYGERGMPGSIEPNSVLIFDVELVSVEN